MVVAVAVVYLSIDRSIYLSASWNEAIVRGLPPLFELGIIKNAAILRDFLNLLTWQQRQTQSTSARLPQFSKLTISKTKQFCEASFGNGLHTKRHLNVQKRSEHVFFGTLTWKCASRHNGVHFFDMSRSGKRSAAEVFCTFCLRNVLRATTACTFFNISTSKSVPRMVCFVHFDFETRFAPQRRALFSTSQLPKAVRHWGALQILTWKCASCHNGVHFFDISTSKSGPTLVCFVHLDLDMSFAPQRRALSSLIWPDGSAPAALSEPTFRPPKPQSLENTVTATFLPFRAPASSFFFLLSSDSFSSLLFSSPLLSSLLLSSSPLPLSSPLFSSLLLSSPLFPFSSLPFSSLLFSLLFSSLLVSSLLVLVSSLRFLFSSLALPPSAFSPVYIAGSLASKLPSVITAKMYNWPFHHQPLTWTCENVLACRSIQVTEVKHGLVEKGHVLHFCSSFIH